MSQTVQLAQPGVITNPNSFAEYLTFELPEENQIDSQKLAKAISKVSEIEKSFLENYPNADLTISVGISARGWQYVFPNVPKPLELKSFYEMKEADRLFPATAGDIFFMIKSERMDLNFQAAKFVNNALVESAKLIEDIQGFNYLDERDLIDFVDGTENPELQARFDAVLVDENNENENKIHYGGSYLTVQRYVTRQAKWDSKSVKEQENVIGRTKADNVEFSNEDKPATAHIVKSKLKVDGKTVEMFRQNRPYGNVMEHGTMFIGFVKSALTMENSLKQMIFADENGDYDHLLNFVEAKTGVNFFMPSKTLLAQL